MAESEWVWTQYSPEAWAFGAPKVGASKTWTKEEWLYNFYWNLQGWKARCSHDHTKWVDLPGTMTVEEVQVMCLLLFEKPA